LKYEFHLLLSKYMKILFQSRTDLFTNRGGDTVQIEYTKEYIEKLFPQVKIDISTEINDPNVVDYDIINLFNLDWIVETYPQAVWAKKHNKKLVLNAIHHSYEEVERFEKYARYDLRRITNLLIPRQEYLDMAKNVARSTVFMKFKKFKPTLLQLKKGIRNQQKEILKMADVVITQTDAEYESIKKDFNVNNFKYKKVVSGVNTELFGYVNDKEFKDYMSAYYDIDIRNRRILLNVGRIEPRKNQINLIKAFRKLKDENKDKYSHLILVFIGAKTKKSPEYIFKFNEFVKKYDDIFYLGVQSQKFVASAMASEYYSSNTEYLYVEKGIRESFSYKDNLNNTKSEKSIGKHITTSVKEYEVKIMNKNYPIKKGIYVQPSWFETLGLVSLEAALSGMNVVASGNRIKEYLKDYAVYCDIANVDSIKEAIQLVLNKKFDKKSKEDYIKGFRENYTWENTAKQTIEVYRELLQNEKR